MICFDCGDPGSVKMRRVEGGYSVVERELCARCAKSRGVVEEPVSAPAMAPAPLGHGGVPWLLPPAAVGAGPPPAPSFVALWDARRIVSTRAGEGIDVDKLVRQHAGVVDGWRFLSR